MRWWQKLPLPFFAPEGTGDGSPPAGGGDPAGAEDAGTGSDKAAGGEGGDKGQERNDLLSMGAKLDENGKPIEEKPAGTPQRPNDIPEKFWNKDKGEVNTAALLKAYSDTQKELTTRSAGKAKDLPATAADYKLEVSDAAKEAGVEAFNLEDPVAKGVVDWAHKKGIGNADLNELFNLAGPAILNAAKDVFDPEAHAQAELEKLGPQGRVLTGSVDAYGERLLKTGILPQDLYEEFRYMAGTANGVKVMRILMELAGEQAMPNIKDAHVQGKYSPEELYQHMGSKRYETDAAFRREIDKAFEDVFGNAAAGSSQAGLGVR